MQLVATRAGVGRLEDGAVALLDSPFPHAGAALAQTGSLAVFATAPVRERVALDEGALLSPVGVPNGIWGVGLNYRSKAASTGRALPADPILYTSLPSSVAGPCASVTIPVEQTVEMDYEGEIAIVVGTRLYCADEADVWPAIAGITAANDLSARDVMRRTATPTLAKSFPGFNPLGASLLSVDEITDRDRITVRTTLNGVVVQDDDSSGLIFPIADLLARISRYAALEPGDVVLTGTPTGTGQDRACFLVAGDEIVVEVGGVLPLRTTVAAPVVSEPIAALLADHSG